MKFADTNTATVHACSADETLILTGQTPPHVPANMCCVAATFKRCSTEWGTCPPVMSKNNRSWSLNHSSNSSCRSQTTRKAKHYRGELWPILRYRTILMFLHHFPQSHIDGKAPELVLRLKQSSTKALFIAYTVGLSTKPCGSLVHVNWYDFYMSATGWGGIERKCSTPIHDCVVLWIWGQRSWNRVCIRSWR